MTTSSFSIVRHGLEGLFLRLTELHGGGNGCDGTLAASVCKRFHIRSAAIRRATKAYARRLTNIASLATRQALRPKKLRGDELLALVLPESEESEAFEPEVVEPSGLGTGGGSDDSSMRPTPKATAPKWLRLDDDDDGTKIPEICVPKT